MRAPSYDLRPVPRADVAALCAAHHGYGGAGHAVTYAWGVVEGGRVIAAYAWQPPPPGAARAVCPEAPTGVLALSRMVAVPRDERRLRHVSTPLRRQMRVLIDRGRWPVLVTYSDEGQGHTGHDYRCPYGLPGSRLWVREAHVLVDGPAWSGLPCVEGPDGRWAYYREGFDRTEPRWRPSIHMPRWACRLTLRVEAVRCGRLHAIDDADALAEGITYTEGHAHRGVSPRDVFAELWDSINARRGFAWQASPWVWVVTFSREGSP